jgi:hypothetical protein
MTVRRGFYLALRWAPIVLPVWYMLAAVIRGWRDIGLLAVPMVGIVLAAGLALVFFLTWIRKDVRLDEAVSWVDVGVLGAWFALILASPLPIDAPMLLFVLIVGIVAFWSAIVQWGIETRRRVRSVLDEFGVAAASAREYQARASRPGAATPDAPLRGQVIRIDPPAEHRD